MINWRQPDIYNPDWLVKGGKTERCIDGAWVMARPDGHQAFSWTWRFKMAWSVFTGECDVLRWTYQHDREVTGG